MTKSMRRAVTTLYNKEKIQIAQYELWSNQKRKWSGDSKLKKWFQAFTGNPNDLAIKLKQEFPQLIGCEIIYLREIGFMEYNDFTIQKSDTIKVEIK